MNIYVGNLAYEAGDEDLRKAFESFGEVAKATVIKDRFTGRSKGFGFVEMPNESEAKAAIEGVKEVRDRSVRVNEARPKPEGGRK